MQKSGAWFTMGEVRLGQGKDAAKEYFRQNPEAAAALEKNVRENFHKLMGNQSKIAARAAGRGPWTSRPTTLTTATNLRITRIENSKHVQERVLVYLEKGDPLPDHQ